MSLVTTVTCNTAKVEEPATAVPTFGNKVLLDLHWLVKAMLGRVSAHNDKLKAKGNKMIVDLTDFAESVRSNKMRLLCACLIVDFIGMMSYMVLLLGELTDTWWAPMSAFFLHFMFGSKLLACFGFLEEFLPFTDIIPTGTIAWAIANLDCLEFVRNYLGIQRVKAAVPVNALKED